MNVLIKRLAIGGVLYAVAETSFIFGKGIMLGILKGYDVSALYATELLNEDDATSKIHPIITFISFSFQNNFPRSQALLYSNYSLVSASGPRVIDVRKLLYEFSIHQNINPFHTWHISNFFP